MMNKHPRAMTEMIEAVKRQNQHDKKIGKMFERAFTNTYDTTLKRNGDFTFVITGDIPAMWLRDSAAQVRPYLFLAKESQTIKTLIKGVINQQMAFILHDPYANAFNETANGARYHDDETKMTDLIWERKYEIDSLCYPVQLAYLYFKTTGDTSIFTPVFKRALTVIIDTFLTEQEHDEQNYRFIRTGCPPSDTLSHDGKGAPTKRTGMTWSGFRPSDDACKYGYLIPSNMFAVVILGYMCEIFSTVLPDENLYDRAFKLKEEIDAGINTYGIVNHPVFGDIYAYETDGFGNYVLMDDANVPSLLSIPYIGYKKHDDPIYLNTRKFVLSKHNPYYYEGTVARGVGSPHTPNNYIWHIALAIEGLTTFDTRERVRLVQLFKETDAHTFLMHEGFCVDDPTQYTRPWFSWANMMFCEFIFATLGVYVPGSPLFEEARDL